MTPYVQCSFKNIPPEGKDVLIAIVSQLNFESFWETSENELLAYIKFDDFNSSILQSLILDIPILRNIKYNISEVENKNWNATWEASFKPINIKDKVLVRASFHTPQVSDYEIVIDPKMAFGTGHHATTKLMIEQMLDIELQNKTVLDFGCGTGILSILAEKRGAKRIDANDIEEQAIENAKENIVLNNCLDIELYYGGINVLPTEIKYDVVIANVTTNIIKENFEDLFNKVNKKGILLLSGILNNQIKEIEALLHQYPIQIINTSYDECWVAVKAEKNIL